MSAIGEFLCKACFRALRQTADRSRSAEDYHKWQYETSQTLLGLFRGLDVRGKRVLELGCGLGGRTVWLAKNGAAEVVGIDINSAEIETAQAIHKRHYSEVSNLHFHPCPESERLVSLGHFDITLLIDSLEHVVSPLKAVSLAGEYTRTGGEVYFSTCGWYHHAGSHTGVPFASVFFSDETIANAIRWNLSRPDYKPTMWDSDPPVARWRGVYNLRDRPGEYLNKITVSEVKRLVKYAPFRSGKMFLAGYRNPKLRWLNPLRHVPVLNEVFHSAIIGVLEK